MNNSFSLQEIIKILKKRLFLIISLIVISAGISAVINYYVLPPVYQVQTQLLVNQKTSNQELYSLTQVETDLQLIDTYNVIIKSPAILDKVIEELDLNGTPDSLSEQISVSNEENSKVVNIKVENQNPERAVIIANKVAEVFHDEIPNLMSVDNISILSEAKLSENPTPVKPNKVLNIAIFGVVGLLVGLGLSFLLAMLDTTIKNEKDIEEFIELPIIGFVEGMKPEKNIEVLSRTNRVRGI